MHPGLDFLGAESREEIEFALGGRILERDARLVLGDPQQEPVVGTRHDDEDAHCGLVSAGRAGRGRDEVPVEDAHVKALARLETEVA